MGQIRGFFYEKTKIQSRNNHMLPRRMSGTSKNNNKIALFFKKNVSQMRRQDAAAAHCNRTPIAAGCGGSFPRNSANFMGSKATIAELNHVAKLSASELGAGCGDGRRAGEAEHCDEGAERRGRRHTAEALN